MEISPIEVRRAEPTDEHAIEGLRKLFAEYPYKVAQREVQKLDRVRLNHLYLNQLKHGLCADDRIWVAERQGDILAAGGLTPDRWHSEIYQMKMGKISPWLNYRSPEVGEELVRAVLESALGDGFDHLSVRLDGEDFSNVHLFEKNGFLLIDISMKFSRPMLFASDAAATERDGWTVRLATAADADWMQSLGARSHAQTHFLNDPALAPEKTQALFAAWVARCIDKLAYRIYVLEDEAGRGRGFVIYLRNEVFFKAVGKRPIILDYVIIDPNVRGSGIGPWFIAESLRREKDSGFDYCELRTSQHNHMAIGCYEKLGFRLCATDFVLHRKL